MDRRFILFLVLLFLVSISKTSSAQTFECAFLQDKYASGKPNKASCSMLPEKVYSTKWYTPKPSEHCDIENVYMYQDMEDVIVDTKAGVVSWTRHFGLTDDAKPKQKKYYMDKGDTEEEANKKVNSERRMKESFRIKAHYVSKQNIFIDDITGKALDPPKNIPQHSLIFSNNTWLFHMYIPESSGYAILMEPSGGADSSWVEMRFGRCRKVKD